MFKSWNVAAEDTLAKYNDPVRYYYCYDLCKRHLSNPIRIQSFYSPYRPRRAHVKLTSFLNAFKVYYLFFQKSFSRTKPIWRPEHVWRIVFPGLWNRYILGVNFFIFSNEHTFIFRKSNRNIPFFYLFIFLLDTMFLNVFCAIVLLIYRWKYIVRNQH